MFRIALHDAILAGPEEITDHQRQMMAQCLSHGSKRMLAALGNVWISLFRRVFVDDRVCTSKHLALYV